MNNDKIVVAYVCDERYKKFLKISMDSIKRYNKNVEFAIMTDKPFEVTGAKVYTIKPNTSAFKFKSNDRMGNGVYYKFYLPELPYDKILFIDCDVVCQRPLKSLWEQDCPFICATESHTFGKTQAAELGLKKYALTGMMLMNLKALREADFANKCLEKLKVVNPKWHDETIINMLFNDRIKFIDIKYNYCRNRKYDNPIAESDAYLLHFVGNQKKDMLKLDFSCKTYIFSNCRTKLPYDIKSLKINQNDKIIFMNTALLLRQNLDYFKQFDDISLYVRAVYGDNNKFMGYSNISAGNYLEDVTKDFKNFQMVRGVNYNFDTLRHYLIDLETKKETDIQDYFVGYPKGKSPTTGYMLYKLYQKQNPVLVNFFNDDVSKNIFLSKNNKDMYQGHDWKFEKEALKNARKVFLW